MRWPASSRDSISQNHIILLPTVLFARARNFDRVEGRWLNAMGQLLIMDPGLRTQPSLLIELRDVQNHAAWEKFVDLYTPLIFQFCRKRGLQDADAADIAQDVMKSIGSAIQRFEYDPSRGGFRNWLFTIVRNKVNNFFTRQQRTPQAHGGTTMLRLIQNQPETIDSTEWDHEYRLRMFHWAAGCVREEFKPQTWLAFWKTAVENLPVPQVAREFSMSEGAVYIARSRVIARLRRQVEGVTGDWEDFRFTAA